LHAPSGEIATNSPFESALAMSVNACSLAAGSSLAGAMGIALAVLKIKLNTGILKIL